MSISKRKSSTFSTPMNIFIFQETDWKTRGPHIQQHLFERLSLNKSYNITVFDYDIDHIERSNSHFIKTKYYHRLNRTVPNENVQLIRPSVLRVPFISRITWMISNFFLMLKISRKRHPDLFIGYSLSNGMICWLFSKLFRVPYVFYYMDSLHELLELSYARFTAKMVTRFLFSQANAIIVINNYLRNLVLSQNVNPAKVSITRTGISLENTKIDLNIVEQLKKKYNINPTDFVLFFMGFLYDFAGLIEIIDYYNEKVKNNKFSLKLLIVGDGGIYPVLLKKIQYENINWVILAGRVSYFELANYIELADLCLLSFKRNKITQEISPIKIFEYMAQKKPTLSTKLPGLYNEIGLNNGVIFSKDLQTLICEIEDWIEKKPLLKEIGNIGYIYAKKHLQWKDILRDFKKKLFNLIIKSRKH